MWNIVYKRDESGGWKRVSHQGKTLPKDILGDSSWHLDLPRDLAAEKTALLDAEAWLALVDAGEYAKAWDVASSAWKGQVTKQHWQEVARTQMGTLGKLVSRAKVATLSTPITQGPSERLRVSSAGRPGSPIETGDDRLSILSASIKAMMSRATADC